MTVCGIIMSFAPLVNWEMHLPSAAASSATGKIEHKFKGKVIVIGAGAAGLYAAYALKRANVDFVILEASATHGGRLRKNETFAKFPIDLGGQWVEGEKSLTKKLADSNKVVTVQDNYEIPHIWFKNKFVGEFPQEFIEFMDILEEGDYESLPDISFTKFAFQEGYSQDVINLIEWIAGEAGTSASRLSMKERVRNEERWTAGEKEFAFEKTYFDLINDHVAFFVKDKILYNVIVKKIDYSKSIVEVTDQKGTVYTANKVIITVPITILKAGEIKFVPTLPQEKVQAFKRIGMDKGMKVFLKFKKKFYKGNIIGGIKSVEYYNAEYGKKNKEPVLMAFVMGEKAERLSKLGKDAIKELLGELDLMFGGRASASFVDAYIQDWGKEPFIRGAYSYETVGMGNAREIGAKPVDKKLYFAGEAFNTKGHSATVHGACETGYNQAINILTGK
jgi:lysine-specific histone demethylase 1B